MPWAVSAPAREGASADENAGELKQLAQDVRAGNLAVTANSIAGAIGRGIGPECEPDADGAADATPRTPHGSSGVATRERQSATSRAENRMPAVSPT